MEPANRDRVIGTRAEEILSEIRVLFASAIAAAKDMGELLAVSTRPISPKRSSPTSKGSTC